MLVLRTRRRRRSATARVAQRASRSARVAAMNARAAIVIRASPMPMSAWTPTIAGRARPAASCPQAASSRAIATAPADDRDPGRDAGGRDAGPRPRRRATPAQRRGRAAYPPSVPTTPMLKMLAPSTTRPPSWKTSAWTATTQAITSVAGPRPEEDRREDAAEQVAGRPADDREVEHLGREDERRHDAHQRDRPLVERAGSSGARRWPGRRS